MPETLQRLPAVQLLPRDEIAKVYDALDFWRDRLCYRLRLTVEQRNEMIVRHGQFAQGMR